MIQELDLESRFDVFLGDTLMIPEGTILQRSQDPQYAAVSELPTQQSSKAVTTSQSKLHGRKMGTFITLGNLQIVDLRFLKVILKHILNEKTLEKTPMTPEDKRAIVTLTLTYGLSSLRHQLKLIDTQLTDNFKSLPGVKELKQIQNPESIIEQAGARIGEASINAEAIGLLQSLFGKHHIFGKVFDGYFAPNTTVHINTKDTRNIHAELIVFNPLESKIKLVEDISQPLKSLTFYSLIMNKYTHLHVKTDTEFLGLKMKTGENALNTKHFLDELEEEINMNNEVIIRNQNKGFSTGEQWAQKQRQESKEFQFIYPPVPDLGTSFGPMIDRKKLEEYTRKD